jgi:hypothetical protein
MIRAHSNVRVLAILVGIATYANVAHAEAPAYARVRSISYAGSGCRAGSVATNVSPDLQAVTLMFDEYAAYDGPGVPLNEKRRNCQFNFDLDYPAGWSFAIPSITVRGYAQIRRGGSGLVQFTHYYSGVANLARYRITLTGPVDRDLVAVLPQEGPLVWSPCGAHRGLNINSEIRLATGAGPGQQLLTLSEWEPFDSAGPRTLLALRWQRCQR